MHQGQILQGMLFCEWVSVNKKELFKYIPSMSEKYSLTFFVNVDEIFSNIFEYFVTSSTFPCGSVYMVIVI
jgi:hypothetical protein